MTNNNNTSSLSHQIPEEIVTKITLMAYQLNPTPSAKVIKDLVNNFIPTLNPPQSRKRDYVSHITDEEFENYDWSEGDWDDFLYNYLNCGSRLDRVKHHPKLFKYIFDDDYRGREGVDLEYPWVLK